jgi:hypothetical protein
VGLVKDEVLDRGFREQAHVGQPGRQHFQLAVVGQQDAGLSPPNILLEAALLGRGQWTHGPVLGLGLLAAFAAGLQVGAPARPVEAVHGDAGLLIGCRADPLAEGDAGATEHVSQAVQLVVGEGVHRVDEDRRQAGAGALIPLPQQVIHDGVEECLRLSRRRAGCHKDVLAPLRRLEHPLLVQVHRGVADERGHDVVQHSLLGQLLHWLTLGERLGERDVRPLDQRDVER